ncbi:hypothetical protein CYMTET_47819 [Cymbomonas tetramitiformis]|uniref:Uncharacterized protein n=1 Tax=Cymbomonas tetramitiformis TaxID=36881 RepID=A0AAE0BVD4_9CHLO|nr:hypothetical protein CYMTET_47819 [Cymbomonas tetramitiformis]
MDVVTGRWEAVESMGTKREGRAVVVQGQRIYAIGGHDGRVELETVERMDVARAVGGGGTDGKNKHETVERMHVATGRWETVGSMRTKRDDCAAVVQGQHIYAMRYDGKNRLETVNRMEWDLAYLLVPSW